MLLKRYSVKSIIGEGTYGRVFFAVDKVSMKQLAIKLQTNISDEVDSSKQIARELLLLSNLHHKNIISLFDLEIVNNRAYIITDYCNYDLHTVTYDSFTRDRVIRNDSAYITILFQIMSAMKYIHDAGVIHRDIKPANILITTNLVVKICDFGFARLETEENSNNCEALTEYVVTRWYRAPEVFLNPGKYGKAQDIWAIGCTFYELMCRTPLFPGNDSVGQIRAIIKVLGSPMGRDTDFKMSPRSRQFLERFSGCSGEGLPLALGESRTVDPNLQSLLRSMLQFNPDLRISAAEAVCDATFVNCPCAADVDDPALISWETYRKVLAEVGAASDRDARLRVLEKAGACILGEGLCDRDPGRSPRALEPDRVPTERSSEPKEIFAFEPETVGAVNSCVGVEKRGGDSPMRTRQSRTSAVAVAGTPTQAQAMVESHRATRTRLPSASTRKSVHVGCETLYPSVVLETSGASDMDSCSDESVSLTQRRCQSARWSFLRTGILATMLASLARTSFRDTSVVPAVSSSEKCLSETPRVSFDIDVKPQPVHSDKVNASNPFGRGQRFFIRRPCEQRVCVEM